MTPVILCITRSRITPRLAATALRKPRSARQSCSVPTISGGRHGVYWTPSPVFLHAEPCERFEQSDSVPQIVRYRLVSVRVYDADDMCLYDLGDVCDGIDVERLLDRG